MSDIYTSFQTELASVDTLQKLEELTISFLGRNGAVNAAFKSMGNLSPEERKAEGQRLNEIKNTIEEALNKKHTELTQELEQKTVVDVSLPGLPYPKGSLHLVSYAIEEISIIFEKLGFIRVSYPEVEWEEFSFEALNMGVDHPARDEFETFFIDEKPHPKFGKMLLTPHTSSGQNREMRRLEKPPISMINIAKTYRPNWDVTHVPMFHQFEGMCIDKGITIAHLKGTIDYFAQTFFGPDRKTRLRPFHFSFTEPSFEVDITCGVCGGSGVVTHESEHSPCKICKSGWLELGGAGMIHPNVLKAGGIDHTEYTGWAFGIGVERVAMMRDGIKLDDLRIMYSGDIRFLEQF